MNVRHYSRVTASSKTQRFRLEELAEYRNALDYVINEVKRLHKLGLSVEARKQVDLIQLVRRIRSHRDPKVYEEIEGKRP